MTHVSTPRALVALLFAVSLQGGAPAGLSAQSPPASDPMTHFPVVEGVNLEGRKFTLPADFEAELQIVFVAFKREQQSDVMTWIPFLKDETAKHRGLKVYELPTLTRSLRFVRRFIDGGMSRGIPDRSTRETTIPLYIDKAPFEHALDIASEDTIRVLLVARDGRVLFSGDGVFAEPAAARLRTALSANTP